MLESIDLQPVRKVDVKLLFCSPTDQTVKAQDTNRQVLVKH